MRSNPRGLVPTLEVAPGKSLYESTVLCEYLEDHYPSPSYAPQLRPEDDYERARSRIWTDYVTSRIIPAYHRLLQFQPASYGGPEGGEKRLDELRKELRGHLLEYTAEMADEGPFFAGRELGLVDIMLIPWALRLWVFDEFKGGLKIPSKGEGKDEEEKKWERWRVWLDAVQERDSVKNTMSEREYYLPIYKRCADDVAQSELAKATRAGRGVP